MVLLAQNVQRCPRNTKHHPYKNHVQKTHLWYQTSAKKKTPVMSAPAQPRTHRSLSIWGYCFRKEKTVFFESWQHSWSLTKKRKVKTCEIYECSTNIKYPGTKKHKKNMHFEANNSNSSQPLSRLGVNLANGLCHSLGRPLQAVHGGIYCLWIYSLDLPHPQ